MDTAKYKITGADMRLFWKIIIPVLIENIINALFGIMDTAMLGKVDNAAEAIAAVGLTGSSVNLFVCVFTAFCVGITVKISQSYGAGNMYDCHRITAQTIPVMTLICLVLSSAMVIAAPYIIILLGARPDVAGDASDYLRIVAYGLFPQAITIITTAAFRGVGQTRIPMIYSISSGLLNVILNYILINGKLGLPAMRVAGAAWATTISKIAACIASVILLFTLDTPVKIKLRDFFRSGKEMIMPVINLGLSSGGEQVILQGGAVITTAIITVLPTATYAAYQVSVSIESIIWAISGAFCVASTSLAGMAKGEGDMKKARGIINFVWKAALVTAAAISLFYIFLGTKIALLYTDDTAVALEAGKLLRISFPMIFGIMTHQSVAGGMRGLGHPVYPLIASLISLWLFRVFGSFFCIRLMKWGVISLCIVIVFDQIARGIINLIFYRRKWKGKLKIKSK